MIEKVYKMSPSDAHVIEPVIKDENIHYMHMVLIQNEALPTHRTNATVYMTVARGNLSLSLEDNEFNHYPEGTILKIPYNTKMIAQNNTEETLELYVVKAPAPKG